MCPQQRAERHDHIPKLLSARGRLENPNVVYAKSGRDVFGTTLHQYVMCDFHNSCLLKLLKDQLYQLHSDVRLTGCIFEH